MQKSPKVVVVGGGIAGVTAALNMAQRGCRVTLIEREPVLGGNARTVCCKAIDGKCQLCGGCLLPDRIAELRELDSINVLMEATVARAKREDGRFALELSNGTTNQKSLLADAIVLATGFDHVDAHTKGPYGLGILPQVTTGEEMERRIKETGQGAYDGLDLKRVAFIQCVGSRDEHVGRGYCSQVCCRYALRLARLLKSRLPEVEITIFKMDIQTSGRDFAATWSASTNEGIRIVAGLPAVLRRSQDTPGRVTFIYDDILASELARNDFDLIVLSTGIQPRRDAAKMADMFGINQDEYGFLATHDDGTSTMMPGVFVAGCCQAPRSMSESVAHAQQAAEACYLYLQEKGS